MATRRDVENVKASVEGDELVLRINLGASLGLSSTGKSILIATTHGTVWIRDLVGGLNDHDDIMLGLNCFRVRGR